MEAKIAREKGKRTTLEVRPQAPAAVGTLCKNLPLIEKVLCAAHRGCERDLTDHENLTVALTWIDVITQLRGPVDRELVAAFAYASEHAEGCLKIEYMNSALRIAELSTVACAYSVSRLTIWVAGLQLAGDDQVEWYQLAANAALRETEDKMDARDVLREVARFFEDSDVGLSRRYSANAEAMVLDD